MGKGINLDTNFLLSNDGLKGKVVYAKPNFAYTDNTLFTSINSDSKDFLTDYGYKSSNLGFAVSTKFQQYDDLFFEPEISLQRESLETISTASSALRKQDGTYFDTYFNQTFRYDKRNQRYKTSNGYISRFSQNIPLISDTYTLTNGYDYKVYNQWLDESVVSLGFYLKTTNSLTGDNVKLSDRLYLPATKLRGFESGKVGPKDGSDYIGGNYASTINLATTLPQILPSLQNTNFSIFLDAANIWGVDYNSSVADGSEIRSSIGIAVDFFTPVGPLNFSLSEPITKGKNDITESFRFNLGTTF